MAPLKSILRSGSLLLGKKPEQTKLSSFDMSDDGEESVQQTLPPRMRLLKTSSPHLTQPSPVKPNDEVVDARTEDNARVMWDENRAPEDDDASPCVTQDDKINKEVDAFHLIESFVSMLSSFGGDEELENPEDYSDVMEDDEVVPGDGLEITLQNYLEYETIRKERLKNVNGSKPDTHTAFEATKDHLVKHMRVAQTRHIMELKDIHKTELDKMKEHVQHLKKAMAERKMRHVLVSKTVEERMRKNFKVLEESKEAQAKIEAECERIMHKRTRRNKTIVFSKPSEDDDDVEVPPPVQCGLKVEKYPEYEVHFTDVPVTPDCYEAEDELFEFVDEALLEERDMARRETMLNDWSEKVMGTTRHAWGNILDFVEDLVFFTRGGYCETELNCEDYFQEDDLQEDSPVEDSPVAEVMMPETRSKEKFAC